jgi:tetratricopeptide (TPR) repeat protein
LAGSIGQFPALGRNPALAYASGMAFRLCLIAAIFLSPFVPGPANAGLSPEAAIPSAIAESNEQARDVVLDTLFGDLAKARTAEEGKAIEAAIFKVWQQSGSASIDLLMSHGLDAFARKDFDRALFYFNEVVTLQPDFVEGWDKRASVYFLKDNYSAALKDLEQVLRLEPRHFAAMGGLAIILEELGDKKGALDVYRRALKLDPWLDGAAEAEKSLSIEIEGRGI